MDGLSDVRLEGDRGIDKQARKRGSVFSRYPTVLLAPVYIRIVDSRTGSEMRVEYGSGESVGRVNVVEGALFACVVAWRCFGLHVGAVENVAVCFGRRRCA